MFDDINKHQSFILELTGNFLQTHFSITSHSFCLTSQRVASLKIVIEKCYQKMLTLLFSYSLPYAFKIFPLFFPRLFIFLSLLLLSFFPLSFTFLSSSFLSFYHYMLENYLVQFLMLNWDVPMSIYIDSALEVLTVW